MRWSPHSFTRALLPSLQEKKETQKDKKNNKKEKQKMKKFAILYIQTPDQPPTRPDVINIDININLREFALWILPSS